MVDNARKLKYPDDRVLYLIQELSDRFDSLPDFSPLPFTDMDSRLPITYNINMKEFTRLLSALSVGADLAYPDLSHELQMIFANPEELVLTCEQIIECIESDADTKAALMQYLSDNGFTQNFGSTSAPTVLPAAKMAESLLPEDYTCEPAKDMAIARAIVKELDETMTDIFQIIEYVTNPIELTAEVTDSVPVLNAASDAASVSNWFQENISESYLAAYTQSVEDTIACAIFCHLQGACDISLDDIIAIYLDLDAPAPPAAPDDINALCTWILELSLALSTLGIVAVFHLIALYLMRFGGKVATLLGFNSIATTIAASIGNLDYSYVDLCDDCPPSAAATSWWMMYINVMQGVGGGWTAFQGTLDNNGLLTFNNGGTSRANLRFNDLGAAFPIRAVGIRSQRRGSDGNGTSDTARGSGYPNANFVGTEQVIMNAASITCNTNNCDNQLVLAANSTPCRCLQAIINVTGAPVVPTNFGRITEVVFYGACNAGNVKPAAAVYVASVPAVGSLFPS